MIDVLVGGDALPQPAGQKLRRDGLLLCILRRSQIDEK